MTTCASGASASVSGSRDSVAIAAAREQTRARHPEAGISLYHVVVTPDSLTAMMVEDLANNQPYLGWARSVQGDAAATRLEDAIRAPYQRRIDQMRNLGAAHQDFDIQVVTVWDSLTFSTRSYDVNFGAMDPVSLLFTGNGSPDSVYRDMTRAPACGDSDGCAAAPFQDDKAMGSQVKGFGCQSSTQWVLMGNAGELLQWRPSTRGLMRSSDKCTQGVRDHMRIFGGPDNDVFGTWSVGTPHREAWTETSGRAGHVIQGWNEARSDFASFWDGFAGASGITEAYLPSLSWGNGGYYQNVEFDGRGIAVDLCPHP